MEAIMKSVKLEEYNEVTFNKSGTLPPRAFLRVAILFTLTLSFVIMSYLPFKSIKNTNKARLLILLIVILRYI